MATPERVTKFVIQAAMKDLQRKKVYKTLKELREDLEGELGKEGYDLNAEDREKIRTQVEEEGYTGRFAIDDIILKKIKNKKYWPLVSVAVAAVIFLLTNIVGAFIQYFVQKPLDQRTPVASRAAIVAFFQLPTSVNGGTLDFKVTIQNQLENEELKDLVLFASAEEIVKKIEIASLPAGGNKTLIDNLNINTVKKNSFAFNAYIIGPKVSFKSEPIMIDRLNIAGGSHPTSTSASGPVAMNEGKKDVAFAERESMAPSAASVSRDKGVSKEKSLAKLEASMDDESRQGAIQPQEVAMKSQSAIQAPEKRNSSEPVQQARVELKEMGSDQLAGDLMDEMKKLSPGDESYKTKLQLLEALAATGNEKAKQFLEKRTN